MDMERQANAAGTAALEGDLADIVARAKAMASSSTSIHHQPAPPPPPAAQRSPHQYPAGQIISPFEERPVGDAVMFEATPPMVDVDPYLSAATDAYGLPQQQLLAFQISQGQHACCGPELVMGAANVDSDDAMRISPPPPAPPHQMISSMPCSHIPYCRKNDVRKVVCIPAPPASSNRGGGGGEVIPSDLWAWRKYGQKPIKGSPYPRGYYKCSSSKGCMARKQVERSRSDPNMLVITYTAEHNHPWPMQRNVLAGYARAHTQAAAKKQQQPRINNVASSFTNNNFHLEQTAIINGDHPGNHMMPAVTRDGATAGGLMFPACNGIQPDEVFAELEELEPYNSSMTISANIYGSRGVSSNYEWHKF